MSAPTQVRAFFFFLKCNVHVQLTVLPTERIENQNFAIKTLTTLYRNSTERPEHPDGPHDTRGEKRLTMNPRRIAKQALKGVRFAATTTTTALGNVASEIAGRCDHACFMAESGY